MANLTDRFIDFMNLTKDDIDTENISILERFKPVARGSIYGAALGVLQLYIVEAAELLEYEPSSFAKIHFIAKWALLGAAADHVQYTVRRVRHLYRKRMGKDDDYKTNNFDDGD